MSKKLDRLSPLGFGMSLFLDLSRNVKSSSGVQKVAEAIVGRLVDRLWYDPDYGVDLLTKLKTYNPINYPYLASECEREILKDDRIEDVTVTINYDENIKHVSVIVNGVVATGETFDLVGSVDLMNASTISFA